MHDGLHLHRRLEFPADADADQPRPSDGRVDLRTNQGIPTRVAANGFQALDAFGYLAAYVEQVLHVEIEAPGPIFNAGRGVDYGEPVKLTNYGILDVTKIGPAL